MIGVGVMSKGRVIHGVERTKVKYKLFPVEAITTDLVFLILISV
jgi:hypothetical protein